MPLGDIPTGFGFPAFIKIILPGVIGAIILTYIYDPYYSISSLTDSLALWIILGIILGSVLMSLDIYIYQLYEGIRFWRSCIWSRQYKRVLSHRWDIYNKLKEMQDEAGNKSAEELKNLNITKTALSDHLREYPNNSENIEATRLGNVLADYETYSREQYGMSFNVFWWRIWLVLPQEIRDEVKQKSAEADFPVYISFIFLVSGGLAGIRALTLKDTLYELISQNFGLNGYQQHATFLGILLVVMGIFFIISRGFYFISIYMHKSYGKYVKAVIDIYRIEYAKRLGIQLSLIPTENEKKKWEIYGEFLQDYDVNDYALFRD